MKRKPNHSILLMVLFTGLLMAFAISPKSWGQQPSDPGNPDLDRFFHELMGNRATLPEC